MTPARLTLHTAGPPRWKGGWSAPFGANSCYALCIATHLPKDWREGAEVTSPAPSLPLPGVLSVNFSFPHFSLGVSVT